jgi:1-acyl-sn-glycerol-3-phosphate acyltransferase
MLVPFFVDVFIGEPVRWNGNREQFMDDFRAAVVSLADEGQFPAWD